MKRFFSIALFLVFSAVLVSSSSLAAETGKPPKTQNKRVLSAVWTTGLKTGGRKGYSPEMASPTVAGGRVFVGTHSGLLYSIDAATGKVAWEFRSNGPIASQPTADGNMVFFGNNEGTVYALDAGTGQEIWSRSVGAEVLAAPSVSGGNVIVVTTNREVHALDAQSGSERWITAVKGFDKKFTMRGHSPAVVSGGQIFVGFSDGQVASLSPGGSIAWTKTLTGSQNPYFRDVDAALVADGDGLYATGYFGALAKLSRGSGALVWQKEVRSGSNMADDGSKLYVATIDGHVTAVSKSGGDIVWDVPLNSGVLSSPIVFENYVFVGTQRGRGYVLDRESGAVIQAVPVSSGVLSDGVYQGGSLYLLSAGGQLYRLQVQGM